MQKMRLGLLGLVLATVLSLPLLTHAEEPRVIQDVEATYLAKVISVSNETIKDVPNTGTTALYQTVTVSILSGPRLGSVVTMTDSSFKVTSGDKVYIRYIKDSNEKEYFSISEPYRLPALAAIVSFFFIAVLLFGGKQGFLSLVALFISFGGIFNFLFPEIISGGNVVLISTAGALLSLFVVMYMTHGFTRLTTAAFLGCTASVLVTLILAIYSSSITNLTGFSDEESVFLNLATGGKLDFVALLVGGIIIGVIGVIDDVAITQASVVSELRHANPNLTQKELYRKAIKVGKDHMGAVINTLILAYTGAALPLVLLLYVSDTPILELINREAIATEIIRSSVGSIGLLCAVPLTTVIAIFLMKDKNYTESKMVHAHSHHAH